MLMQVLRFCEGRWAETTLRLAVSGLSISVALLAHNPESGAAIPFLLHGQVGSWETGIQIEISIDELTKEAMPCLWAGIGRWELCLAGGA